MYNCSFDSVHCNLMDGWWMYEIEYMDIYIYMEPSKNQHTIHSEAAIQCSDRTE